MERVIELLKGERKSLKSSIKFYKDEIEQDKNGIQELQSDLFLEKHKDDSCWSDNWTIHDYIKVNVESRNRSIDNFSKRLKDAEEYLSQIEKALKILKGDQEVMGFKEEDKSSTCCETCKNYESHSDITGWCSACPGTVIRGMNANNTCAAYEKKGANHD